MDSDKPKRDSLAKLKLLGGILRLVTFSHEQLAAHANVNGETVRSFVEDLRKKGTLETVQTDRTTDKAPRRSGRPKNIYRLRADRRQSILDTIVEVRRSIDGVPSSMTSAASQSQTTDEDFTPLALLEAAVAWLAADTYEDTDDRLQRLDQARIRLAGAEADFRAMLRSEAPATVEQFALRLSKAREQLSSEAARQPSVKSEIMPWETAIDREPPLFPVDEFDCSTMMRFLVDWSVSIQSAVSETPQAFTWTIANQHPEESTSLIRNVLLRTDALMRSVARRPQSEQQAIGRKIAGELTAVISVDEAPSKVMKLAVSAALVAATDAAEPLLLALLRPGMMEALGAEGRELCSLALARLARPSTSPALSQAAGACLLLLNRDASNDVNVPILVPAALQFANANEKNLLNLFAATLYDETGLAARWRSRINESAVLRNLAWVMRATRYSALYQEIPHLVERNYGAALLKALISKSSGALRLVDRNRDEPFVISPGRILANQAGLADEPVPFVFQKKVSERLSAICSEANWDEQDSAGQSGDEFTSLLGKRDRPALRLITGRQP
jgi:hypothetical protein